MKNPPALYLLDDNYYLFKGLPNESAGILIKALYEYNHNGSVQDLPNIDNLPSIFELCKAQIDRNREHYAEVTRKRSEAGKKGGAPKGNQNARKGSLYSQESASFDIEEVESKSLFDD